MTITLPQLKGRDILTHSREQSYKRCPQEHFLAYELGIRPDDAAKPLRMGGAYHIGLEARSADKTLDEATLLATAQYEVLPKWATTDELVHEWMIERETVAMLLAGYYWRWSEADAPGSTDPLGMAETISNEQVFTVPIVNPDTMKTTQSFRSGGKMDQVVRLTDGRTALKENKTCSEDLAPESDYWKRLRIDQQISNYYVASALMNKPVDTVLYDATRKPLIGPLTIPVLDDQDRKIVLDAEGKRCLKENILKTGKPGKGHGDPYESGNAEKGWVLQSRLQTPKEYSKRLLNDIYERPDFYYRRMEIPRLEKDLEDCRYEKWQLQQQLRDSQRLGRWFRNTNSCRSYLGTCRYFEICTNGIDVTKETPKGFVRVANIHPELESPPGDTK